MLLLSYSLTSNAKASVSTEVSQCFFNTCLVEGPRSGKLSEIHLRNPEYPGCGTLSIPASGNMIFLSFELFLSRLESGSESKQLGGKPAPFRARVELLAPK